MCIKTQAPAKSVVAVGLSCLLIAGVLTGCRRSTPNRVQNEGTQQMKNIDQVIKEHADSLLTIPGVVGVYRGMDENGRPCVKVMVREKTPRMEDQLPKQIEGYRVVIEETGEIRPMR